MAYNTETRTEPTRIVEKRSSSAVWLIAGIVIVAAIVGFVMWSQPMSPFSASTAPQVENNITVEQPAPSTTTTMDAQPSDQAPVTTITPAPAPVEAPAAPAAPAVEPPAPAQAPVTSQ